MGAVFSHVADHLLDGARIYVEQKILVRGEVRARCVVEGLPFSAQGKLTPGQFLSAVQIQVESPPVPEEIALWVDGRSRARLQAS